MKYVAVLCLFFMGCALPVQEEILYTEEVSGLFGGYYIETDAISFRTTAGIRTFNLPVLVRKVENKWYLYMEGSYGNIIEAYTMDGITWYKNE